jgi:hypothetical protein
MLARNYYSTNEACFLKMNSVSQKWGLTIASINLTVKLASLTVNNIQ